jgi:CubicO group peptidase (beta-lactamase class C family)
MVRFAAKSREFARAAIFAFAASIAWVGSTAAQTPATGTPNPAFAGVDQAVTAWMAQWGIPGGSVAIAYKGNIVYTRGYGYANANTGVPTQPDTLFRVASLSKAITSAGILMLADAGQLNLDDKVYPYLAPDLAGVTLIDSRIANITLRQLLHHTSGIDDQVFGSAFGQTYASGNNLWKTCRDVIAHDLPLRVLDFVPGTQFQYTDYGYCMLSRVIEKASGYTYEQFVSRNILSPLGIATAHAGDTLSSTTGLLESFYHDKPGVGLVTPLAGIYPGVAPALVSRPYGSYYLEGYSGAAVWVASATDYLRFMLAYREMRPPVLFSSKTQALIYEQPAAPMPQVTNPNDFTDSWYGLGVYVRQSPTGSGFNTFHDGLLYGARSYNVAYSTDIAWVTLFNSTPETYYTDSLPAVIPDLDNAVATALSQSSTATWPTADVVPPAPVPPQAGWWWNPAESGRGYAMEFRGGQIFFASFLYNDDGTPRWLAANGAMTNSTSYTGNLSQYSGGQTLGGSYQAPSSQQTIGGVSINFTSPTTATLVWPGGSTPIQRFEFATGGLAGGPAAGMPETGWWWNPLEGGRGFYVEVQGSALLFSGYMYDANGQSVWYSSEGQMQSPGAYQGELFESAGGQTLSGGYKMPTGTIDRGPVTIQFSDQQNGTLTLPTGQQVPLTRFRF